MAAASTDQLGGPSLLFRGARATRAKRSLAEFVRQAIEAGVVEGIQRVEWGPHLDALCSQTQLQLEAWLVAYGLGTPEMVERQREAWSRPRPIIGDDGAITGYEVPVWEDGEPEPWLRYVLVQNEIDNLPPGTLKSTIVMVCACAWIWLWAPRFAFGASSGIDLNVKRDSDACRELVKSPWYRETFDIAWTDEDVEPDLDETDEDTGITIRHDAASVSDWKTTRGGRRLSRTVGRGFTGAHVDGLFLDDPDDADKVWNEASRLRPQNRFGRAMRTRVNCEHRSIRKVMQQVVHPDGFTAFLLSLSRWSCRTPKGWARLCLPAEYGMGPPDAPTETPYGWRDWRTEPGQVLHPRLSAGVLADYRANMPDYSWQFNQHGDRDSDGILKRHHARFFVFEDERDRIETLRARPRPCPDRTSQPPVIVKRSAIRNRTLSVDANNTLELKPGSKPSAVGLLVLGMARADTLVLDDRTRILDISGTYLAIYEAIAAAWPLDEILVELKAAGPSVINELRLTIRRGWYVHPVTDVKTAIVGPDGKPARPEIRMANPRESKAARNQGLVQPWQSGTILAHDGAPWLYPQADVSRKVVDAGFIGEVCSWAKEGDRGDRMDALSQYVARHRPTAQTQHSMAPIGLTRTS